MTQLNNDKDNTVSRSNKQQQNGNAMRQLKMLMLITNSSELLHVLRHWNPNQSVKSCFTWSRHLYQPNNSTTSHFRFNDKFIYCKIIITFSFTRRPRSFSLGVLKNIITIKIKRFKLVLIIYFIKLKWLQGTDLSHHTTPFRKSATCFWVF